MNPDPDDALNWGGDEGTARQPGTPRGAAPAFTPAGRSVDDTALSDGWNAVGKGSESVGHREVADGEGEREPLSTAMLLTFGIVGGIYLLYSVGWLVGGLRLKPLANFFVTDAMFLPWLILAVAAPFLWFVASWALTRSKTGWIRVSVLLLGVILLVPWPFVTMGAIGL